MLRIILGISVSPSILTRGALLPLEQMLGLTKRPLTTTRTRTGLRMSVTEHPAFKPLIAEASKEGAGTWERARKLGTTNKGEGTPSSQVGWYV